MWCYATREKLVIVIPDLGPSDFIHCAAVLLPLYSSFLFINDATVRTGRHLYCYLCIVADCTFVRWPNVLKQCRYKRKTHKSQSSLTQRIHRGAVSWEISICLSVCPHASPAYSQIQTVTSLGEEPLLKESKRRFVLYPIQCPEVCTIILYSCFVNSVLLVN